MLPNWAVGHRHQIVLDLFILSSIVNRKFCIGQKVIAKLNTPSQKSTNSTKALAELPSSACSV